MILKFVAIGAAGYAAYRVIRSLSDQGESARRLQPSDIRIAGGPLSADATIQDRADQPSINA